MKDEVLYEVDRNDQVIGPRTRGDIHRLGLIHRAVHILVFNDQNNLFLQKRSERKDVNPGLWDTSAAGHVDFGESYHEAALRELNEELGIDTPDSFEFLYKLEANQSNGWEFIEVYRTHFNGKLQLNEDEISEGQWLSLNELDDWLKTKPECLTDSFIALWNQYLTRSLSMC
jgi:isopentenyl-diphosphate delta-isomerase type 1